MDFQEALEHLRDAVTLKPRIKEALVELVEVLYQLYKAETFEEAKKWIKVAEKEDIFPAKMAFLKGMILQKEGNNIEAIGSFEKAKALDESLTQSVDIQIAVCYMNERELKKAEEHFRTAVQVNPQSDLASFARQYQDMLEKRLEAERPFHLTLGVFGQYDTNVVLKPLDSALAPDITDEESRVTATSLRLDYVPVFEGPWLFNAQYSFNGTFHDKFSTSHDSISNGIYVAPGYNFGTSALNLSARFNHSLVRSPDYEEYVGNLNIGFLYRRLLTEKNILETFVGHETKQYYDPPLALEEDRDSRGLNIYFSWVWLFKKDAFFNLKYEFNNEDTDGANWDNKGHEFALNVTIPLMDKVKLQMSGQAFLQDYRNIHTVFETKRKDDNYSGMMGLSWEFYKKTNLIAQFTKSKVNSNIGIYEYTRELYSLGIEYKY